MHQDPVGEGRGLEVGALFLFCRMFLTGVSEIMLHDIAG